MSIKALAMDVDGVLTDGGFWWGPNGEEWKRFCFLDIMGLSIARKSGLLLALVSGEDTPLIDRMATKMSIPEVHKGIKDKAAVLRALAERHQLKLEEICFMGDDINDLPALEIAGLAACPATAHSSVQKVCTFIASKAGGNGAVREVVDYILAQAANAAHL